MVKGQRVGVSVRVGACHAQLDSARPMYEEWDRSGTGLALGESRPVAIRTGALLRIQV